MLTSNSSTRSISISCTSGIFLQLLIRCCLTATFASLTAYAGLLGTTVTASIETGPTEIFGPQNFVAGSTYLNCTADGPTGSLCDPQLGWFMYPYSVKFTDNQIIYQSTGRSGAWSPGSFVGWRFTNLNLGSPITGVVLESTGYPENPNLINPLLYTGKPIVTFTADSVSVNLAGDSFASPNSWTVTLQVTTVQVTPSGPIAFTQPHAGPTAAAQTLRLTTLGGNTAAYSAQVNPVTGGNWLQINSAASATGTVNLNQTFALSVNPAVANALPPGQYTSQINLAFPGTASPNTTVPISLTVVGNAIAVSPASLAFTYVSGDAPPPSLPLTVTTSNGAANFTASASSAGNWLSIDTAGASTPKTINVSINLQNVPSGSIGGSPLNGTISINAPGMQAPIAVNVVLLLPAPAVPQPATIQNSASLKFGAIAPGEFITILGSNLGPSTPASFTLNPHGGVDSTLAGVLVMFDSFPGTPTYVSATQINVVAPYEIAGRPSINVFVVYQGRQSAPIPQTVVPVSPAIFTFTANGKGQAVAADINASSTSVSNGPAGGVILPGGVLPSSPAAPGSYISVYGTGGGITSPGAATGTVNSSTTLMPIANWTSTSGTVTATIGGVDANVFFAGAAPGLISGAYQFVLQIPPGISGDALPLTITVNGVSTPTGPTLAVQ
jgi:uncharacterized protein (TIGR03437 family)